MKTKGWEIKEWGMSPTSKGRINRGSIAEDECHMFSVVSGDGVDTPMLPIID